MAEYRYMAPQLLPKCPKCGTIYITEGYDGALRVFSECTKCGHKW